MSASIYKTPIENALFLGKLAQAAYVDNPKEYSGWEELGIKRLQLFASDDFTARGFVAADEDNTYLAFRGTDDVKDFLMDINVLAIKGYGGRVHKGFSDALESVWKKVAPLLRANMLENRPIWITGHSLGGAMALLAGQRLIAENFSSKSNTFVVTFGQPRVGDAEFSQNYPANLCRFLHRHDLIPAVPPKELSPDFTHIGDNLWLTGENGQIESKPSDWTASLVNFGITLVLNTLKYPTQQNWLVYFGNALLLARGIDDHRMKNYLREIEAAFKFQTQIK